MTPEDAKTKKAMDPNSRHAHFKDKPDSVDTSAEGKKDHPLTAIKYAEEKGIKDEDTIISTFTPKEKDDLLKLIKHGEFNAREAAVIKALICEAMSLEELGVYLGVASPKTKGEPMSKVAALKELNRILSVLTKRAYLKTGKKVDLKQIAVMKRKMKEEQAAKNKKAKELAKKRRDLMKEFWKELYALNKVQREHGLKPSRYDKTWTTNTTSLDQLAAVSKGII